MMRRWRSMIGVVCLSAALGLPALAQEREPSPGGPRPPRDDPRRMIDPRRRAPQEPPPPNSEPEGPLRLTDRAAGAVARRPRLIIPTDAQWEQAERFMSRYTPRRLQAVRMYGDASDDIQMNWRAFAYNRYLALLRLQTENPELYEHRLKMMQAEDEIWGLGADYASTEDPALRNKIREQLRQKIADLLQQGLDERERRLARLQEMIQRERHQLEKDRANQEQTIQHRLEEALSRAGEVFGPDVMGTPGRRPGLPGEGPPPEDGPPMRGPRQR